MFYCNDNRDCKGALSEMNHSDLLEYSFRLDHSLLAHRLPDHLELFP